MSAFIYSYRLVSPGRETTEGTVYDSPHASVEAFGRDYADVLDTQGPPLPYPVTLHVWQGEDISRDADFMYVRRRRSRTLAVAP